MGGAFGEAFKLIFSGDSIVWQIIGLTFKMTLISSVLSLIIGVPIGVWLGISNFKGRKIIIAIDRALEGLPPVVCGLFCFLLFSGVGPLGGLHLLYTVTGMVIAQILLLLPMAVGLVETYINGFATSFKESAKGMGLKKGRSLLLLINESRYNIISTYLFLLGRALAEVGAVSIVGGAIMFKTNVMTTAIMNYTSMGNFKTALALGIILLFFGLLINIVMAFLQGEMDK